MVLSSSHSKSELQIALFPVGTCHVCNTRGRLLPTDGGAWHGGGQSRGEMGHSVAFSVRLSLHHTQNSAVRQSEALGTCARCPAPPLVSHDLGQMNSPPQAVACSSGETEAISEDGWNTSDDAGRFQLSKHQLFLGITIVNLI